MLECHPQTLRLYEREGLIVPYRSHGGVRLYCDADIELLRRIQRFPVAAGKEYACAIETPGRPARTEILTADHSGLITIPRVRITSRPVNLRLTRQ